MRFFLIILIVNIISVRVSAQEKTSPAKNYYKIGKFHFTSKNYEKALQMFLKAFEYSGRTELFFNIAVCYEETGDIQNAVHYYKKHRKAFPTEKTFVNSKLITLYKLIKDTKLRITGGPPEAKVFINGIFSGNLPLSEALQVRPGIKIPVRIVAVGYDEFNEKIVIRPGVTHTLNVVMFKKSVLEVKTIHPKAGSPVESGGYSNSFFNKKVGLFTATGVLLAGGIVTGLLAVKYNNEYKDNLDRNQSTDSSSKKALFFAASTDLLIGASIVTLIFAIISDVPKSATVIPVKGGAALSYTTSF